MSHDTLTLPTEIVERVHTYAQPVHPCKNAIESVFIKYLTTCALEKRGPHLLSALDDKSSREASLEDVIFLKAYVQSAIVSDDVDVDGKDREPFLQRIAEKATIDNVRVHLTRDYQVIETGSHYVNLSFCVHMSSEHMCCVSFRAKFKVSIQTATHHLERLMVTYSENGKPLLFTDVDPSCALITDLPSQHFLSVDYVPNVDNTVEACVIA